MLEIGSIVDGKYKILNKIGQGGMSVVYLAMNERANKQWAIKEIRKDGVSNYEVVKQGLIVETDLLKKLNHPHLPSIIDVIDGDDTFLIVMDYIEGNSLSKVLKRYGAQAQEEVIEWAKQLCDVLGYLHSRQPPIVYRDMKPANVMLKPDGNVTLIDFGTAREYKSASIADTTCLGTQGYAAPEQFGGHGQTDARTDIYCLGATMYHLVTGHNPAEPPYEMYPIRQWNPRLSSGLEAIILKCTQKNPNDRYQSCAELMYALEHYRDLENETMKEYTKKWRLFLGSAIATVLALSSTIGFMIAEKRQIQGTYDYCIEQGQGALDSHDFDIDGEAFSSFEDALELAPEKVDAYNGILDAILGDNVFTAEESEKLTSLLSGTGKTDNVEQLKDASRKDYDKLAYELGEAYYFFYEEPTVGVDKAGKWYNIAASSDNLDDKQKTLSKTLASIISYSDKLDNSTVLANGKQSVSFANYWEDLNTLIKIDYDSMGSRVVEAKVYGDFVAKVKQYESFFKAEDITDEQILEQYEYVLEKMEKLQQDDAEKGNILPDAEKTRLDSNIESLKDNIDQKEKSMNQKSGE